MKNVYLVVLNYNDFEQTKRYVKEIQGYNIIKKIIIVDNCSTDNSYDSLLLLKSQKIDVIQTDYNGGYGYGNNYGIKYIDDNFECDYIIISNPDVSVDEKTIQNCLKAFFDNQIGIVSPLMYDKNNKPCYWCAWKVPSVYEYIFSASCILSKIFKFQKYNKKLFANNRLEVGCVAGSFLIIRNSIINNSKLYDERMFLFCEETLVGLCLSKRQLKTILVTNSKFIHYHGVSIKKSIRSRMKMTKMMLKNRLFLLKNYYGVDNMLYSFARVFYAYCAIEHKIIFFMKKIFHKN